MQQAPNPHTNGYNQEHALRQLTTGEMGLMMRYPTEKSLKVSDRVKPSMTDPKELFRMPKETSSRTAILQNLWKKAHIQGQVAIPVPSKSDAQKLRFDLYNVVKACKKDPKLDAELAEAANNCSISFVTETTVLIKKKVAEMFLIEAALLNGIDPTAVQESPRNEAELAALESQKRLAEAMNKGAMPTPATQPQHRPNAYFDRTKD